jgi:four helix bundle protein
MRIFILTKAFPKEEMYSLTDKIRRSRRSVCANTAEAWRKRRYPASFCSKLTDAEAELAETQCWIRYAIRCGYLPDGIGLELEAEYEELLKMCIGLINTADKWCLPRQ